MIHYYHQKLFLPMKLNKIKMCERVMSAFASLQRTLPASRWCEMYQNYTAVLYQNKTALDTLAVTRMFRG